MTHALLIGNPNCGKTTLFNALTNANQRVGNWPGVTVEKKTGEFLFGEHLIEITDLPGVYSLVANAEGISQDEQIAAQSVVDLEYDCIINVIDACHLERHLYLTSQLFELGKPVIVALNMMDIAEQRGISIDIKKLKDLLGCAVIPIQAHKNIGILALQQSLLHCSQQSKPLKLSLSVVAQHALDDLENRLLSEGYNNSLAYYFSRRIAEGDTLTGDKTLTENLIKLKETDQNLDVLLADARYQKIHEIVTLVQKKSSDASEHFTAKLDKLVLHRFLALPIFFAMMYLMFLFAINIGGAFQDFFDISTETIFVQGSGWLLQQLHAPNWVIALVASGVGKGINTTITFIPVIAAMFFFMSLLETSGYMARAAFVVDKAMRAMGLPGKSFVPMIVGFGCNVPAIMAARTLDSERDRLLTVMMSPFMSCSARLAIYTVFVAAFFPSGGHNVVFSLYLIGILMAVFTGFILRKTTLKGHASPLILELPAYHRPSLRRLLRETSLRLRFFVFRAGKLIIPICVILGGLNAITLGGGVSSGEANTDSLLSIIGQWITPLFAPMGIHQDNWPATVGLLTGMLAKEVVVGTLNSLYAQVGHLGEIAAAHFDFWGGIKDAFWSIPANLSELGSALWNPVSASAADSELSQSVYGIMSQRFDGAVGAYAYLLFVLLYIPCVSTMAVIRQEANRRFMWTSIIWSFVVAYASSVVFYQGAKFLEHPQQSMAWIFAMSLSLLFVLAVFRFSELNMEKQNAAANT
ncbi:TPA: Fe(2+) transporter permease subunit FeoB [Legionella pneumophila]|uniref:Fe(2+) transporter permease subunit FeoB n=1 Tax=Legionella pneumophila TaxID=446 RepID=UPI00048F15F6|nr:Fe(2+) transporter permease subunit FeoB [Legionella pneumophila]RYB37127.1 Fe(2+) transporter permease subunit FeoB [Legionella pneumophila]RYW26933.1 Fe(2+) transporter permease subunit FeoB [Legionella pneumophila]HAT1868025.1 Fe(2+) transporter permease subunit FeoB [Legionella pneumophila]HAT1908155.1 Fe(2+) transporter permease subunit FeoB [Legionella pneumophila]HAT1917207.1 Fe(2+) transporter permease subunit FeoB [Legionella pneumophila]